MLHFQEPLVLQHGQRVNWDGPDFKHESASENERLCRLWDARGLLALFSEPPHPDRCCRIFNAHKNSTTDRQIGDRRWVNGSEYHPTGNKQEVNWPCFRSQRLLPSGKGHSAEGRFQLFAFFVSQILLLFRNSFIEEIVRPVSREADGDRYGMKPMGL